MTELHDYAGIIHFHSEYSHDGRIPLKEILSIAGEQGIDFLLLTDHSSLEGRWQGMEGWNNTVLLVVGQEISPRFNHYLAFGIDEEIQVDEQDIIPPQGYVDRVRKGGGIGFIAHPDHEGTEMFHVKHFPWVDWDVSGYTGMGVWDFMTDWQASLRNYPRALMSYLFPAHVLRGPRQVTLDRWDRLNQASKISGIGELDNHDTPRKVLGISLSVFPFRRAFRLIRTHVVLHTRLEGTSERDIPMLLDALKEGRAYIALEYFERAKGFSFSIAGAGVRATMGEAFPLAGSATLQVRTPVTGKIRVLRNGHIIHEVEGREGVYCVREGGVYRVEVYLRRWWRWRPWIFSNPIAVTVLSVKR